MTQAEAKTADPKTAVDPKAVDPKAVYETWEKATTAWFDAWARSPAYLAAAGRMLEAQLGLKSAMDGHVADALEAWKIPSARDLKALAERIAAMEERIARVEEPCAPPPGADARAS